MRVFAGHLQAGMSNPFGDHLPWYSHFLQDRNPAVTKRMRRPDRDSKLLADWFQHFAVDVVSHQWSAVPRLEQPIGDTVSDVFLQHLDRGLVDIDITIARFSLRSAFDQTESSPPNVNNGCSQIDIFHMQTANLTDPHAGSELQSKQ